MLVSDKVLLGMILASEKGRECIDVGLQKRQNLTIIMGLAKLHHWKIGDSNIGDLEMQLAGSRSTLG